MSSRHFYGSKPKLNDKKPNDKWNKCIIRSNWKHQALELWQILVWLWRTTWWLLLRELKQREWINISKSIASNIPWKETRSRPNKHEEIDLPESKLINVAINDERLEVSVTKYDGVSSSTNNESQQVWSNFRLAHVLWILPMDAKLI